MSGQDLEDRWRALALGITSSSHQLSDPYPGPFHAHEEALPGAGKKRSAGKRKKRRRKMVQTSRRANR